MKNMNRLNDVKSNKIFTKGDVLIIFCIVVLVILTLLLTSLNRVSGVSVEIYNGSKLEKTLPLSVDYEYRYEVKDGYNIIKIENHKVCVIEADCSNQVCVRTGKISKVGEEIVCLPHKLRIVIVGKGGVDAVS